MAGDVNTAFAVGKLQASPRLLTVEGPRTFSCGFSPVWPAPKFHCAQLAPTLKGVCAASPVMVATAVTQLVPGRADAGTWISIPVNDPVPFVAARARSVVSK